MNRFKWLLCALFLAALFGQEAKANTFTATTCNTSDVQSAINSAAEGDTVIIPAGTCTWTSGVTTSGKGIIIQGAGSGRIIAYTAATLTVATGTQSLAITLTGTPTTTISSGETLRISETGSRSNWMQGTVTSYSGGTLSMNITTTGGSGSTHRWLVSTIPSTVLINNSSSTMFAVTEDSSVNTRLGGFKIQAGSGTGDGVTFNAGGGKPIVLHDCWIEQGSGDSVWTGVNRGLIYNCSFDSSPFSMAPLAVHLQPFDQTAWTVAGYWGALDTNGAHNFYVESSDFHAYLNAGDNDEGARSVWRYSVFNNAGFGTHGVDTGLIGQRYFEYYNNTGVFNAYTDGTTFNMNWWFFVRGGTYVIFDNTLPPLQSQDYGTKDDVNMTEMALQRNAGPIPCWGAGTSGGADYYAPRQVGIGYVTGTGVDGIGQSTYSLASFGYSTPQYVGDHEPAYIWGNSRVPLGNVGTEDYGSTHSDSCSGSTYDTSANYIVLNRDYFNGTTAKPGYTPYQYPHPLETSGSQSSGAPAAPTNLSAAVSQ